MGKLFKIQVSPISIQKPKFNHFNGTALTRGQGEPVDKKRHCTRTVIYFSPFNYRKWSWTAFTKMTHRLTVMDTGVWPSSMPYLRFAIGWPLPPSPSLDQGAPCSSGAVFTRERDLSYQLQSLCPEIKCT